MININLPTQQRIRAFTLIELLVVLVIIGIVITIGFLYLTGFGLNAKAKETAAQLKQVMQVATEQAIMQPATLGMRIDRHGYRFFQSTVEDVSGKPKWVPLVDDQLSRPKAFDSRLSITVKTKHFDGDLDDVKLPEIVFFPSGLASPATVIVSVPRQSISPYRIQLRNNADVTIKQDSDE